MLMMMTEAWVGAEAAEEASKNQPHPYYMLPHAVAFLRVLVVVEEEEESETLAQYLVQKISVP
jgi:hypothetical protein